MYMIYTNSENVPPKVHSALEAMSNCHGLKVPDMLLKVVKSLDKSTSGSQNNPVDLDDPEPMELDSDPGSHLVSLRERQSTLTICTELEQSDDQEDDDSDAGGWSPKSPKHHSSATSTYHRGKRPEVKAVNARLRRDLRMAKDAGFRVGYHGSLLNGGRDGFVTISCRIAKLGISDEALQAWHLEPRQYFIVLIRYVEGYMSLDRLLGSGFSHDSQVQIRSGVSHTYKVSLDEAIASFTTLEDKSKSSRLVAQRKSDETRVSGLGRLFIGRPLDDLLNERLIPLLRYRIAMSFSWGGAEEFFNDHQGRNLTGADEMDSKYWAEDDLQRQISLPSIVTRDHLADKTKECSLPLLTMQFALRHLVRCTEFCLVCHCKVEADFEALKPYVCSKPLCLYQYMSLGFGPSIEHEIITQPHVVDLLISFCYTSARHYKLRYLPTGMALMVPAPSILAVSHNIALQQNGSTGMPYSTHYPPPPPPPSKAPITPERTPALKTFKAKFDSQRMELIFGPGTTKVLNPGNWITFPVPQSARQRYHCRVAGVLHPTVILGKPFVRGPKQDSKVDPRVTVSISQHRSFGTNPQSASPALTPAATPPPLTPKDATPKELPEIEFSIYDQNFDDLEDPEKHTAIHFLLDTLPSVQSMSDYLQSKGGQEMSLRSWTDRISPAALGLLRWIIASNRSCIIQVDSLDGNTRKSEERVSGLPGWMQFRFAQGAPDKEQRFVTSIKHATNPNYPTMFAWHGSPLWNWHGIVREGLHFEKAAHGRAFGDGVYHSLQFQTSMSYSGYIGSRGNGYGSGDGSHRSLEWAQSQLNISQAIALNEIVNAPSHFVSSSPHLVVAQLDWIQSRYLFVKCNTSGISLGDSTPGQAYEQDKSYTPIGESGKPIVIPITAVSKCRRKTAKVGDKRKAENVQEQGEAVMVSDDTDDEDLAILCSDDEEPDVLPTMTDNGKGKTTVEPQHTKPDASKTDFIPGALDQKTLPLLEPPSYATSSATKALQRELTATLKVQDMVPADQLGWYIDGELVNNVYQWIVELHSFESHLPLAKDMRSRGVKSVVIEIRFGKDYPMSPPFVRVIRPRFLGFQAGGGGHVTAGGALCMELLTNSGWSAASNIESVLLQVRLAMSSTDPRPARLEPGPIKDYQVGEAIQAFIRACNAHGVSIISSPSHERKDLCANILQWQVPEDIKSTYSGLSGSSSRY